MLGFPFREFCFVIFYNLIEKITFRQKQLFKNNNIHFVCSGRRQRQLINLLLIIHSCQLPWDSKANASHHGQVLLDVSHLTRSQRSLLWDCDTAEVPADCRGERRTQARGHTGMRHTDTTIATLWAPAIISGVIGSYPCYSSGLHFVQRISFYGATLLLAGREWSVVKRRG